MPQNVKIITCIHCAWRWHYNVFISWLIQCVNNMFLKLHHVLRLIVWWTHKISEAIGVITFEVKIYSGYNSFISFIGFYIKYNCPGITSEPGLHNNYTKIWTGNIIYNIVVKIICTKYLNYVSGQKQTNVIYWLDCQKQLCKQPRTLFHCKENS
jgi:hypothetical protein